MKILSWNSQGLVRLSAQKALRRLRNENDPDCIWLMEPKPPSDHISIVVPQLGFRNNLSTFFFFFEVHIIERSDKLLAIEFSNVMGNNQCWLVFLVHATPYINEKAFFWAYVSGVVATYDGSWTLIGDLNEILSL